MGKKIAPEMKRLYRYRGIVRSFHTSSEKKAGKMMKKKLFRVRPRWAVMVHDGFTVADSERKECSITTLSLVKRERSNSQGR